jgi:hypothetical protein
VIWDFVGEPFDPGLRADLERVQGALRGDLGHTLANLLAPEELSAMQDRVDALLGAGVFPEPVPGTRPFPWPPI